jgi:DNA-directed RNA polymerase specialized sigma24 family protein
MRPQLHAQLLSIARRETGTTDAADVVQDALLIAVEAGRFDLTDPANMRWLSGVVRNRARMASRTRRRRLYRETAWQVDRPSTAAADPVAPFEVLPGLPPALKVFAALVLSGHNRREIAYLLRLPDTALRQRVTSLKRHLLMSGLAAPTELTGLNLDLAYGRIRDALLPALLRHGGLLSSHDPDGHLFVVRPSQKR